MQSVNNCYVWSTYGYTQHSTYCILILYVFLCCFHRSILSWYVHIQHTYCRHSRYSAGYQFLFWLFSTINHIASLAPYHYRLTIGCTFTKLWVTNKACHTKDEQRLVVFQYSVLRGISGPKREETQAGCNKLHSDTRILHDLCYYPDIVRVNMWGKNS
jgi:hypothetical protein